MGRKASDTTEQPSTAAHTERHIIDQGILAETNTCIYTSLVNNVLNRNLGKNRREGTKGKRYWKRSTIFQLEIQNALKEFTAVSLVAQWLRLRVYWGGVGWVGPLVRELDPACHN